MHNQQAMLPTTPERSNDEHHQQATPPFLDTAFLWINQTCYVLRRTWILYFDASFTHPDNLIFWIPVLLLLSEGAGEIPLDDKEEVSYHHIHISSIRRSLLTGGRKREGRDRTRHKA